MLTTVISIFAAIALLMPGFIIAELSLAGAARSSRSDLELALRAITYALVVHLVFGFWTVALVDRVEEAKYLPDHLGALSAYTATVLLGAPVILGLALKAFLGRAELGDGPPGKVAASLGAGEARDAFDYAFQRRRHDGAWVIVELLGHSPDVPRLVGGLYGRRSAVGQTPSLHDVYLEALCTVDENDEGVRTLCERIEPERGVYLSASQIARIDVVPGEPSDETVTLEP